MGFTTNYRTEEYALTASWGDFPKQVQEHARMCAIDLTAALILGSYGKQFNTRLSHEQVAIAKDNQSLSPKCDYGNYLTIFITVLINNSLT